MHGPVVASWFDDGGGTACGTHLALGFASTHLACGTRVRFCYRGCATGVVEDYGPDESLGRLFDLNAGLKAALGCTDLCHLRYRVLTG